MIDGRAQQVAASERLRAAYEAHATALLRMCVLLTGRSDMAEELVQESFVRAHVALQRLEPDEVRPYLRTTALNLWRNRLRRLAIERRVRPTPEVRSEVPFEERDAVWAAVRMLPTRQRACLVLRYYEDLSERETAALLGCSVGTVKSQVSRALDRLRGELGDVD